MTEVPGKLRDSSSGHGGLLVNSDVDKYAKISLMTSNLKGLDYAGWLASRWRGMLGPGGSTQ